MANSKIINASTLITLVDQPYLSERHLKEMSNHFLSGNYEIVCSQYGDSFGPPAIFSPLLEPELANLPSNKGAKKIIGQHKDKTYFVRNEALKFDIDTPDDLRILCSREESSYEEPRTT